jgi:hypothetical protein
MVGGKRRVRIWVASLAVAVVVASIAVRAAWIRPIALPPDVRIIEVYDALDGRLIHLHKNERFLFHVNKRYHGNPNAWSVSLDDPGIVAALSWRTPGDYYPGVYQAIRVGITKLHAEPQWRYKWYDLFSGGAVPLIYGTLVFTLDVDE